MRRDPRWTGFELAAADIGMPLTVVADSLADGREEYGSRHVLVRPDQHVAWSETRPRRTSTS